jgi:hypothetical protein
MIDMSDWLLVGSQQTTRREAICAIFWPRCCAGIIADYAEFENDYEKLPILFPGEFGHLRVGPIDISWGPIPEMQTESVYYKFGYADRIGYMFRYIRRLYLMDAFQATLFASLEFEEHKRLPYEVQREYCIALGEMLAAIQ